MVQISLTVNGSINEILCNMMLDKFIFGQYRYPSQYPLSFRLLKFWYFLCLRILNPKFGGKLSHS